MLVERELLKNKSESINLEDKDTIRDIVHALKEEAAKHPTATGLAAPQIGIFNRVIICTLNKSWVALVNPVITKMQGRHEKVEGCVSIEGLYSVTRPTICEVQYYNEVGKKFKRVFMGQECRRILHEVDHLNGICIDEIGRKV